MKKNNAGKLRTLRLWPGVIIVVLQWLLRYVLPIIVPDALNVAVFAGVIGGLVIFIWWGFFSKARAIEKLSALALMIVVLVLTPHILHPSIAESGMGFMFYIYVIPGLCLAFVVWAFISQYLTTKWRWITMVLTILLACTAWALVRTNGFDANFHQDFAWRWTQTAEDQLLEQSPEKQAQQSMAPVTVDTTFCWPGFRGAKRDGIVYGTTISTDWTSSPPELLWKVQIGPGWSSFAVDNGLLYTQEQRGDNEDVSCYQIANGMPVWGHSDQARFWEANAGPGPRATPTLYQGRVYALGATGIMNVLDAQNGNVIWSRNAAKDTGTKTPIWGFAASPVIYGDRVIVAVAGSLIAYDLETGEPRWSHSIGGECYSSPHLVTMDSVQQVLLQNETGIISVSPADGDQLWDYAWAGHPIVQPAITPDGDILISVDEKSGMQRISVTQDTDSWTVEKRWETDRLRPYFNDSVIHKGYVYGFFGPGLACINVNDGERQWRGGRYGRGQILLLADQDVLLVISEKGDLALVQAVPDGFTELARVPAIEGKTWNHPVLAGDILLVRNGQEMAAFRLAQAG